jgi:hypothetical protein
MQRHINDCGREWDADAPAFFKAYPLALEAVAEAAFYRMRARRTGDTWDKRRRAAFTVQAAAIVSACRWLREDPANIPQELLTVYAATMKAASNAQ